MLVECVKRCLLYSKGYIREGRYCSVIVLVPQRVSGAQISSECRKQTGKKIIAVQSSTRD